MVEHLNMILLTSSELFEMRNQLKELNNAVSSIRHHKIPYFIALPTDAILIDNCQI